MESLSPGNNRLLPIIMRTCAEYRQQIAGRRRFSGCRHLPCYLAHLFESLSKHGPSHDGLIAALNRGQTGSATYNSISAGLAKLDHYVNSRRRDSIKQHQTG